MSQALYNGETLEEMGPVLCAPLCARAEERVARDARMGIKPPKPDVCCGAAALSVGCRTDVPPWCSHRLQVVKFDNRPLAFHREGEPMPLDEDEDDEL